MHRASRRIRLVAMIAVVIGLAPLTGCAEIFVDTTPGDPVGHWRAEDGTALTTFKADRTGVFTMCRPSPDFIPFEATSFPSTIDIWWSSYHVRGEQIYQIEIRQDWKSRQLKGVGFPTINRTLVWKNGNLEMGADFVVVFERDDHAASCGR